MGSLWKVLFGTCVFKSASSKVTVTFLIQSMLTALLNCKGQSKLQHASDISSCSESSCGCHIPQIALQDPYNPKVPCVSLSFSTDRVMDAKQSYRGWILAPVWHGVTGRKHLLNYANVLVSETMLFQWRFEVVLYCIISRTITTRWIDLWLKHINASQFLSCQWPLPSKPPCFWSDEKEAQEFADHYKFHLLSQNDLM